MKKKWLTDSLDPGILKKWRRIMRLTTVLIMGFVITVNANSYSQNTRLDIRMQNQTIRDLIEYVEENSEFVFLYKNEDFNVDKKVNLNMKNATIYNILDEVLEGEKVVYDVYERQVIIRKAEKLTYSNLQQDSRRITGTVTDQAGLPLPGVSVVVKGSTVGTVTSVDGTFSFTVPADAQALQFSFVGMQTQDVLIAGKTTFVVVMAEESIGVDEVVVTALGIEKSKRTLTYVTQKVDMENLATVTKGDVGEALAGKVAGVSVMTGANGGSRIIIRGERSINGSNTPLVIMDGVPSNFGLGNVDDIESINVLKGPSASALYGAAAANGVIIVTTKKGKKGETKVEVNSQTTFGLPYLYPEFQNEYGQGIGGVYSEAEAISSWGPKMSGQTVTNWTGEEIQLRPQPNNVKDIFRTSHSLINSLSYSTGNQNSTAYFSYTNKIGQGLLPVNSSTSHQLNMRLDTELVKNLKLDVVTTWSYGENENTPVSGDDLFSPMWQLVKMPRSIRTSDIEAASYYDETGSLKQLTWAPNVTTNISPYWSMYGREALSNGTNLNTVATLKYNFTPWLYLQFRGRMAYNYSNSEEKLYWDTQYVSSGKGKYSKSAHKSKNLNGDVLLGFDKDLTKDFHLSANLGSEIKDSQGESMNAETGNMGLILENKFYLSNGSSVSVSDGQYHTQIQSVYGTAQIGFRNYLFMDVTARNDWSSTLPSPYSFFYPSVGLTSVLSDIFTFPEVISFAKIRGSYAEVGNGAGFAQIFQTYSRSLNGTQGLVSLASSTKVPSNLIPEETRSWEAGAEIRVLEDRLGVDFTWYKANTYNQLVTVTSPPTSGFSNARINCGNIQNKGIEIMLNAVPVQTGDLKWDIGVNFTRNWSKVIELTETLTEYEISAPNLSIGDNWIIVGRPYGEILSRGFVRVKDVDETRPDDTRIVVDNLGMPRITSDAKTFLGNYNYMWRSGLTSSLKYKNWNLYFLIDLNYGGVRQSATEATMMMSGNSKATLYGRDGFVYDGVKQITNEDGSFNFVANDIEIDAEMYGKAIGGRATNGSGEAFNHDATNSRLREFSVGYTFPIQSQMIKNVTVSAIGRNLFYFYNGCKWFDPDMSYDLNQNGQGSESAFMPGTRNVGFNIKVTF